MTPQQVLEAVRNQLYESSAGFWSDSELYGYMSDSEQEISDMTKSYKKTDSSTTTVASQQEYSIPTDCQMIERLLWDSVPLKKIDFREKDAMSMVAYGATDYNGNPVAYYEYGSVIGLYPIPASAKTLKFYYVGLPARLSAATVTFSIPALFHAYLQDYILWRAYAKDQDSDRSDFHSRQWEKNVELAKMKWSLYRKSNRFSVVKIEDNYPQTDVGII